MRILMLCPFFFPETNAAAARAMAFAKYLVAEGAEVHVIVPETNRIPVGANFRGIPLIRIETYDNLREQMGALPATLRFTRLVRSLRRQIEAIEPDVVMSTTPSPFFAFEGHLACRSIGIPVVFDVRDAWVQLAKGHPNLIDRYIKERIEGQCCWGAKKVLAVTDMLADLLAREHGMPRERIVTVHNGADLENFSIGSTRETDIILLGAPSTYRNLEEVLLALSLVVKRRPSTSISYVGWADNDYAAGLKALARNLGLADFMEFRPPVPHDQVPSILAHAKIGLISLADEVMYRPSVGAKTYEYMAAGLALACLGPSGDCELRRLIDSTGAGFFESDFQQFAERMTSVLQDETLLESMSKKARTAAGFYDRKAIVKRVYHEVLVPIVKSARKI